MDLSYGVPWLCMLLWTSICFRCQTGYSIANGYNLHKSPELSRQVNPGNYLKQTYEEETDVFKKQSFLLSWSEPFFYKDGMHFGSFGSFPYKMPQSQTDLVDKDKSESEKWQTFWGRGGEIEQTLQKRSFFSKPVNVTKNIIPATLHGKQVFIRQSAHHPYNGFADPDFLLNYLPNPLPGGNNAFSFPKNKAVHSGFKQSKQRDFPLSIFSGKDSFMGHMPAATFHAFKSPSKDFIISKKKSNSAHLSHRPKGYKTKHMAVFSPGFNNGEHFHKVGQHPVLSLPKPPSLNYVLPIKSHVPNYEGIKKRKTSQSLHMFKSHFGKKSEDGWYPPTLLTGLPDSASNSKFLSPSLGLEANKLHKDQDGSHLGFNLKPQSPLHGSIGHSSKYNSSPFILAANPGHKKNPFHYKLNGNVLTQHKNMNSVYKKRISPQTSLSAQDRFLHLNGDYDAMKAGLIRPRSQPENLHMLTNTMKTEPTNFASWPLKLFSEPTAKDLNCKTWKKKGLFPPTSKNSSRSSVNLYVRSKKHFERANTFLSRTCYKPPQ